MQDYEPDEVSAATIVAAPSPEIAPEDLVIELELLGVDTQLTASYILGQLRQPRLLFFLSRHVCRRAALCVVPLRLSKEDVGVRFSLRVPAKWLRPRADAQYAGLGVTLYDSLQVHDEQGRALSYACWQPRAYGWMPLTSLLHTQRPFVIHLIDTSHMDTEQQMPSPLHVLGVRLHKAEGTRTGTLFQLDGTYNREREQQETGRMKRIFEQALSDYGSRRFIAWQPELEGIHVPVWYSAPTSLPGAAFCLEIPLKASQPSEAWPALESCLRTAICTDGWTDETEFVSVLSDQLQRGTDDFDHRFHRACRTIQQAMCLAANSCDYTPDIGLDPEQKDVERFVDATKTRAVDCEDSAKLCFLMAWLLLLAGTQASLTSGRALLYWAGIAMRCFVPAMFTTSASAPSAGGGSSEFTQQAPEPINHIAAQLVPRFLYCQWLANAVSSVGSYERLKRACEIATGQPERAWEAKQTQLWIMEVRQCDGESCFLLTLLQGTTYCDGGFLPYHQYFAEGEREQVKQRVITRERTRMFLEQRWPVLRQMNLQACAYNLLSEDVRSMPLQEFSPFYRYPSHLWSPALLMWKARADADLPIIIDFHVRYTQEGAASYGVRLQDLVARCSREIALEPVYVLSPGDYELLLNRVAQQEPVLVSAPDLLVPGGRPSCTPAKTPSQDELVRRHLGLAALLRLAREHPITSPADVWSFLCYRVNNAAKLSPELVQALEQMLATYPDALRLEVHVHGLDVGELYIVEVKIHVQDVGGFLERLISEQSVYSMTPSQAKAASAPSPSRPLFRWEE